MTKSIHSKFPDKTKLKQYFYIEEITGEILSTLLIEELYEYCYISKGYFLTKQRIVI